MRQSQIVGYILSFIAGVAITTIIFVLVLIFTGVRVSNPVTAQQATPIQTEVIAIQATNTPTIIPTPTMINKVIPTAVPKRKQYTGGSSQATPTERRKGFHCLDGWDGNHNDFERLVKDMLNDPGSMETHYTEVAPVVNGRHSIRMNFGARNAMGGTIRTFAYGSFDHYSCEPKLDYIE